MNSSKNIKVSDPKKTIIKLEKKNKKNKNSKNNNKDNKDNKDKNNKNNKNKKDKNKDPSKSKIIPKSHKKKNNKKVVKPFKVSFSLKKNKVKKYYNPDFRNEDEYQQNNQNESTNKEFKIEELPEFDDLELFN